MDRRHLVNTGIDLLPTRCEVARSAAPADAPGYSLLALCGTQPPGSWRDAIFCETGFARGVNHTGILGRGVRSERYKYIVYNRGECREHLFDLVKDPLETRNLAVDPPGRGRADCHAASPRHLATRHERPVGCARSDPFLRDAATRCRNRATRWGSAVCRSTGPNATC